jgi:protein-histidine pros-kinase
LSESEARVRAVLNSAISAVVVMDATGHITDWNARAEQMFGWAHQESRGQDLAETIIPPRYREAHRRGTKHFLATGEGPVLNRIIELNALRRDGSEFPVELSISPVKSGGVMTFCSFITDITERKRTEETDRRLREVQEQNRLVVEANRMKSEFLANMSHELRTPLNGIIGFSEFLADEKPGKVNEKQKEYLGDILNSGRHLLQLINDVLDLSKVEAGKMELFPETFALQKSVDEVCAIILPLAKKKNVAIQKDIGRAVEMVTLDPQKFKQVLFNLLSNAVKFTDEGGRVRIEVAPHDTNLFRMSVSDTGIGIKPQNIDKLFVEFQQLDSGMDRRYEGTGLGLALTKKIVEFQGGHIAVESEPGKGSVFNVVLPVITGVKEAA